MTDNEIIRKIKLQDEIAYFKERVKDFFDKHYKNNNGCEDTLDVCIIREGYRTVLALEEETNRQKAEIERLKEQNNILSINADAAFQEGLNEAQDLYAEQIKNQVKSE